MGALLNQPTACWQEKEVITAFKDIFKVCMNYVLNKHMQGGVQREDGKYIVR